MIAPSAWTARPAAPAFASDAAYARHPLSADDVLRGMWLQRGLMLVVFLAVLILGLGFAFTLKATYPAHSSLLVRLGQEYVYEPRIGDAGRGALPSTDQVIQSEVEILGSPELHQQVVEAVGVGQIEPSLARKFAAAGPDERATMIAQTTAESGERA